MYINIVRWWLTLILLFLPFQHNIVNILNLLSFELAIFFNRLDEFTIVIFFPLAIKEILKIEKKPNRLYFILLVPIFSLSIYSFISGMVNGNYLLVTIHGTFSYVKYFLVIFIYAAFFREYNEFEKLFRLLLIITVFLGLIAFIQEAWAMGNKYILQKKIRDIFYLNFAYFYDPGFSLGYDEMTWRMGILRVSSLMINQSFLGLYILLILVIYAHITEKVNFAVFVSLFPGIFGSVSRVVYTSFILIGGIQIIRGKKWWIVSLIPITICLFYMSPLPNYINSTSTSNVKSVMRSEGYKEYWDGYRDYFREKSIEIWKDHYLLGVGPGMYGGAISLKYKSHIYEKYNFNPKRKFSFENWKTIDQFWYQVLAELGIIGIICFTWVFISLATILFISKNRVSSNERKGLFTGLLIFFIIMIIYTFAYDLNIPPITFTYFAFMGVALATQQEECKIISY